jgi:hypothetical protein
VVGERATQIYEDGVLVRGELALQLAVRVLVRTKKELTMVGECAAQIYEDGVLVRGVLALQLAVRLLVRDKQKKELTVVGERAAQIYEDGVLVWGELALQLAVRVLPLLKLAAAQMLWNTNEKVVAGFSLRKSWVGGWYIYLKIPQKIVKWVKKDGKKKVKTKKGTGRPNALKHKSKKL